MKEFRVFGILLPLAAALGCVHHEPNAHTVQRQMYTLEAPPKYKFEEVTVPIWPEEKDEVLAEMQEDGWWLAARYDAAEAGTFVDDPIKHKMILVFQRYATRPVK